MNELSERARLLISRLAKGILDAENTVEYCDLDSALGLSFAMPLIEQALLAERRLAMELAIKEVSAFNGYGTIGDAEELALLIRAAAGKEVGTK